MRAVAVAAQPVRGGEECPRCGAELVLDTGRAGFGPGAGGVPVALSLMLPVSGISGELLGLGASGLVLADLSPGLLLTLLGTVAGGLGLGAGLLGGAERLENTMIALLRLLQRDASSQTCGDCGVHVTDVVYRAT
ncbi:hypothetical protein ACTMTI_55485 [Nonomuraea sp. H19]|uniref:hypothetical protein n=1 Tax=Nonomuraea sp. H19 TaxID=3452206 RepID=UPI003F8B34C1